MESIYPEVITTFAAVVLYGVPVAVAVLSYLLGCINGAIATSHIFYHDDVRRHGSGNAGLTNFYRNYGAKCAPMVIAFDMLKAVGAVLLGNYFLGYLLGWGAAGKYFGALFCVIGHMFPVFYGFKGGKGVLHIAFYSDAQLQQFAGLLGQYDPEQAAEAADPSGEDEV